MREYLCTHLKRCVDVTGSPTRRHRRTSRPRTGDDAGRLLLPPQLQGTIVVPGLDRGSHEVCVRDLRGLGEGGEMIGPLLHHGEDLQNKVSFFRFAGGGVGIFYCGEQNMSR